MFNAGYLFRNAQYRLELQRSMDDADGSTLPPVSESAATPAASPLWDGFAEGSQLTKVQGEVLRWHNEHGTTSVPAAEYISMLENEVAALRKQVNLFPSPVEWARLHMVHPSQVVSVLPAYQQAWISW